MEIMNKMKTTVLAIVAILFTGSTFAQSIEDGKKFLYYERYKSAKDVFQKLSSANPGDEAAAYYLGQAMIGLEDVAGAKAMYLQKLSATPNSPLLLAGMGHIGLIEGSTDARSRFDAAVSLSASKRIDVLNAVGAPNSDPEMKNSDANYAIDKLKLATTIKGFKDPEVWANLGDAYRKIGDGGSAIQSYDAALRLDPNYARAIYRKGGLYQSQGLSQEPLYLRLYDEAIAKDANYAPVYNKLSSYFYSTNVTKSANYLDKALAVSDDDPNACYKRASMKFAQGLNADAVAKADECIAAGGTNVFPNLYGLKAYALTKLNDSANAKTNFEEYFKKQIPSKIGSGDYSAYAMLLLKFPGNEAQAAGYVEKAVALDSIETNKVTYLKALATAYVTQKNFGEAASWFNKILSVKKNYSNVDLYNAGYNYFRAAKFDSSVAVFNKYTAKYPDEMFGYYMIAKANSGIDSTMKTGLAATSYLKAIEVGEKMADKTKIKDYLVGAYTFMMQYSFNIKKDQAAAISYIDKALLVDPTDAQSIKNKDFVTKNSPVAPSRPATTTKPAAKPAAKPATKATPAAPVKKPTVPVKKK
jgi:tetratricopeptide (TPR) repeat protein